MRDHSPEPQREQSVPAPRPTRAGLMALQSAAGNRAMSKLLSVQRNVGIELEDPAWTVSYSKKHQERVRKSVPIAVRTEFQVQAEDGREGASSIEIVSHPPGVVDDRGLDALLAEVDQTVDELDSLVAKPPFPSKNLTGGKPGFWLSSYQKFRPELQMTLGVPLAHIPALHRVLRDQKLATVQDVDEQWAVRAARRALRAKPSPELTGLVYLIRAYLEAGDKERSVPLLKQLAPVMARTDFATMFAMIPEDEQRTIRAHQNDWVDALVSGLKVDPGRLSAAPVFFQTVNYEDKGLKFDFRNTLTRRAWLEGMAAPGGADRLSAGGKANGLEGDERSRALEADIEWRRPDLGAPQLLEVLEELHEGFGALGGRIDRVVRHAPPRQESPAAILEIRDISPDLGWRQTVRRIHECLTEVIGEGGSRPFSNVMTEEGAQRRRQAGEPEETDIAALQWGSRTASRVVQALSWGRLRKGS